MTSKYYLLGFAPDARVRCFIPPVDVPIAAFGSTTVVADLRDFGGYGRNVLDRHYNTLRAVSLAAVVFVDAILEDFDVFRALFHFVSHRTPCCNNSLCIL